MKSMLEGGELLKIASGVGIGEAGTESFEPPKPKQKGGPGGWRPGLGYPKPGEERPLDPETGEKLGKPSKGKDDWKKAEMARLVQEAERTIQLRLPDLIDKMFVLAEGFELSGVNKAGEPRSFRVSPDYKAISYLMDRGMGKARQTVDVTGEGATTNVAVTIVLPDNGRDRR